MKKISYLIVAGLMASLSISCHHQEAVEHEHHDHGEQMTAYSNNYELFAEMPAFVVGEQGNVVAYLTKLSNFKPLDSARVSFVLKVGDKEQRVSLNTEKRGMYQFSMKPEAAGCGSAMFEVERSGEVESVGFGHLHVYANHEAVHNHSHSHEGHNHEGHNHEGHNHEGHNHSHGHNHEGHGHEHGTSNSNSITFTKEQSWKVDFATEVVEGIRFGRVIKTSAQVQPSQGDEREVAAKASGIVIFNNPNLVEGAAVTAGQRLFTIESSGMADNNMGVKFQEATANYQMAKAEYERKQELAADRIVSQSELQRAKMEFENAKAVYDNLKTNFSSKGQLLSAPMSGYVKNILVKNGSYVEAGQPIMTITQNKDLVIRAEVQPRYFQDLSHIVGATIKLMNSDEVYDINANGGSCTFGRSTDPSNPLIPVTFKFRNTVNLLSGGFVTLYIRTQNDEEVVTVANTGIIEEMGAHFVFVQISPIQFEKREVTLGVTDGLRTVVASGLKAGERVVSKGALMVKLAEGAGALDPHAGHVH